MRRADLSIVGCDGYRSESVAESIRRALDLLGGARSIAAPGESVFVKTNAVMAVEPSSAIVTNPAVVEEVVRQFMEVTERVTVGDSPGGPLTKARLSRVFEKSGVAGVAARTGAELAMDTETVEVPFPEGRMVKRLSLCRSMVEADRLVSVSKFKTHRYMNVTGPIKNLYGCVAGMQKFVYHSRFDNDREFADLIVDVHLASNPAFHIVDAVEVIDGDGSRKGRIRNMGVIAAGSDAFSLESLLLELAGLSPDDSRPLKAARERGLCPAGGRWYSVRGEDPGKFGMDDFMLPGRNYFSERTAAMLTGRLSRFLSVTPKPLRGKCTGCGTCARVCPRGAITVGNGVARVDSKKCIRCFCCDELCEYSAVGVRKPLALKLAESFNRGAGHSG